MKILVSGYYGFGNAGDELILESIISELSFKRKDIELTVLSSKPKETSDVHKLRAVDRWNFIKVFYEILRCKVLISGGGGLFQDNTGNIGLYYYLLIILLAKIFGKKVYVYGAGVNNLKRINRIITTRIFKHVDGISVRESDSFSLLTKWGLPGEKIKITADPVILKEVAAGKYNKSETNVVFILQPPLKGVWNSELFAKLADAIYQRLKANLIFIPFYPEKDAGFSKSVMKSMKSKSTFVHWKHFDDIYNILGKADLVISQRLHGLILALLYGIPIIGISEDDKIDRFMKELGQKNITAITDENYYLVLAVVFDMWEWRDDFKKNAKKILPDFKLRAKKNSDLPFLY
jgi:polysaccharide pyruvyl transferase CsaB